MKITKISINGIAGIESLVLNFNPQMNIICGPNGIGKTTILECIAHLFAHTNTNILKRNVKAANGLVNAVFDDGRGHELKIANYEPNQGNQVSGIFEAEKYLLSLKTTRTFSYKQLTAIEKDSDRALHFMFEEASKGVSLGDIKNWFVNRHLFSVHANALSPAQHSNFDLAKKCFSALNDEFVFGGVDASSLEIAVNSPGGKIYYEYLSSGFKSSLSIMFGIIKEIEFRFPNTKVEEFSGIVVLDEVELHLHPEWQGRLPRVLMEVFPNIQFIMTTHSPHVIQAAESHEIIALESRSGHVELRTLPESPFGFKGWTVDEVLIDVMGMSDTRTEFFNAEMTAFERAVDSNNFEEAAAVHKRLDAALHPKNPLRKLMSLQLSGVEDARHDQA